MLKNLGISSIFIVLIYFFACARQPDVKTFNENKNVVNASLDTITLGAGCFWCLEAIFQQLRGVHSVESGYSGGHTENPTYKEVCTGLTGHAEVCQVTYDPSVISYAELLEVFWKTHDPTTLNRQGNDVGPQYRSVIFYHTDEQKKYAEKMKSQLDHAGIWKDPIVTEITSFKTFYKAETYHQEYYFQNRTQPYCRMIITPKLEKFRKAFTDKLNVQK